MSKELWEPPFEWIEPDGTEPEPPADEDESAPAKRLSRLRLVGAVIVTAAVGVGSYEVVHATDRPNEQTQAAAAAPSGLVGCPPVSASEKAKVQKILKQPVNPVFRSWAAKNLAPGEAFMIAGSVYQKQAEKAAKADDLTLLNDKTILEYLNGRHSTHEQLVRLNEFFKQYGFRIDIFRGPGNGTNAVPFTENGFKNLESYGQFRTTFEELVYTFQDLPVEEVKATGLKEIRIVAGFHNPDGKDANIADEAVGPSLILAGVYSLRDQRDTYHEMGHLFDYNYCGEFDFNYYDPAFTNLNPPSLEYGTGGYWQNATVSQYGSSNMREDKAEMYSQMLDHLEMQDVHSKYPAIRQKYALLLERLDQRAPGIAKYLGALAFPG